jgi:predicted nucleic acid-binding protein
MKILLDTNILGRLINQNDALHSLTRDVVTRLELRGHELVLSPQNLIEYRAIATRPVSANGLGRSADEANQDQSDFESAYELLPDTADIFPTWTNIVIRGAVLGKKVHDARLIAVTMNHRVGAILTFNTSHFVHLCSANGIQLIDPHTA